MSSLRKSPRAIADVSRGIILAEVEIAVPPERVFRALTESADMVRWWGSADTYRTEEFTADLRVGGKVRASGRGLDGKTFAVEGEYLELDPPRKIVQTWAPSYDRGVSTTVTYLIEAIEGGSRLIVRHEGFGAHGDSCRGHGAGWERVLGWLVKFLDS